MILFCRYGTVPGAPEKGFIFAHHDDAGAPDASVYPSTLAVPDDGPAERFGLFGPAPEPMGEAPSLSYPDHDMLDVREVRDDHFLRNVAGLPVPDNRRTANDTRRWAAPDLTPEVARRAKRYVMARAFDEAAAGGFDSAALGGEGAHRYPSDGEGERRLQMAALAALAGQSKPGWTATLRCAEVTKDGVVGFFVGVPHGPAQVHAVLADYQAFADAIHAERDAIEARIAAAGTVDDILAIARTAP